MPNGHSGRRENQKVKMEGGSTSATEDGNVKF